MKTDPKLTETFGNKLWIKFFLTAVYSTMWVRDHQRPLFHEALGVDVTWYGQEVFRKTSEISKQVFPMTLDIDHPRWRPNLDRMEAALGRSQPQRARGGSVACSRWAVWLRPRSAFVSVFTIPAQDTGSDSTRWSRILMLSSPWIAALIAIFSWWFFTGIILLMCVRKMRLEQRLHGASVVFEQSTVRAWHLGR